MFAADASRTFELESKTPRLLGLNCHTYDQGKRHTVATPKRRAIVGAAFSRLRIVEIYLRYSFYVSSFSSHMSTIQPIQPIAVHRRPEAQNYRRNLVGSSFTVVRRIFRGKFALVSTAGWFLVTKSSRLHSYTAMNKTLAAYRDTHLKGHPESLDTVATTAVLIK